MTDINFSNQPFNTAARRNYAPSVKLFIRFDWLDPWEELQGARLDSLTWSVAPTIGRCQFTRRYGYGFQPGEPIAQETAKELLTGAFLKVLIESDTTEHSWSWYGVIEQQADGSEHPVEVDGTYYDSGRQRWIAYSLERLLDSHRIMHSYYVDQDEAVQTAQVGLEFNRDDRPNRREVQDVSFSNPPSFYVFESSAGDNVQFWSSRDIVEYLVRSNLGTPRAVEDQSDIEIDDVPLEGGSGINWTISDDELAKIPDWDRPRLETHLVSAKGIYDRILNRRRLFTWWIEVGEDDEEARFRIATFNATDVDLGEGTIPANEDIIDIFLNNSTSTVSTREDRTGAVDQVIAYGARRQMVTTLPFKIDSSASTDACFINDWSEPEDREDYQDAGDGHPSWGSLDYDDQKKIAKLYRGKPKLAHVFSRFKLNPSAAYTSSDSYQMFHDMIELAKLPLLTGVDYSGNTIASANHLTREHLPDAEERDVFVVIEKPSDSGKYYPLDQVGEIETEIIDEDEPHDWKASIRLPRESPRTMLVSISKAPQHVYSQEFVGADHDGDHEYGDWDWKTMKATVAIIDERYAQAAYPANDDILHTDAKRVMRLKAGDSYRQIYVEQDTIVDLQEDGTPRTATNDGYLVDDTPKLESLAEQAYQWYRRYRKAVTIKETVDDPAFQIKIGQMLNGIERHGKSEGYDTLITQISLSLTHHEGDAPPDSADVLKFELQTDFGELDVLRLMV